MAEKDREYWDHRYRTQGPVALEPSLFLEQVAEDLPRNGTALDVAGGAGRHAVWLAERGLDVTLTDISPEATALTQALAQRRGLRLHTLEYDHERNGIPTGPWDVILCFHFLRRDLFRDFERELAPGGRLVVCLATRTNLERHTRPGPDRVVEDGELPGLVGGLRVLRYKEGWDEGGYHDARLVAVRDP